MKQRRHWLAGVVGSLTLLLVGLPGGLLGASSVAAASAKPTPPPTAASPTVSGPVTGGNGKPTVLPMGFNLGLVGYEESEYFTSGTATSYTSGSGLTSDGRWTVSPSTTAPYTTRIVVRRPVDPKRFNGTVIVEWLNVSGGVDADPDWTLTHNKLIRSGFVWVGVSAQAGGVSATKSTDPVRYGPLSHPGDSFSYDIFSQAGQAVRNRSALVLGGLKPRKVIAIGESQSAGRLVTYIDAVHPLVHEYDGFLVHSRFASGAMLSQTPQAIISAPPSTMIRDDLRVPVFVFETETDVFNSNLADRQPDTNLFRLWEVAGTAHYDTYGLVIGPQDTGNGQGAVLNLAAMQNPPTSPPPGVFTCNLGINTGGGHWVLDAAVDWLNQWVVKGVAPPIPPRLQVTSASPVVFATDANGNVLGGVRTPQVDAPIATLTGTGNTGSGSLGVFCAIFGTTSPFSPSKLATLYPSHKAFVSLWHQSVQRDLSGGFLLRRDAVELDRSAANSQIGK
jgi:hypothetical protein